MAAADLSPSRRVVAAGAAAFVGFGLGGALGIAATGLRLGALPLPSAATAALGIGGLVAGALALASPLGLRLLLCLSLFGTAALVLTRFGPGPGLAFTLPIAILWALRLGRERLARGGPAFLGVGGFLGTLVWAPALLVPTLSWSPPGLTLLVVLALGATIAALVDPGDLRPPHARFDLRVALAIAGLLTVGLSLAFLAGQLGVYVTTPSEYGGLGMRMINLVSIVFIASLCVPGSATGPLRSVRASIGLGLLALGFLLAAMTGAPGAMMLFFLAPIAIGLAVEPCLRRAERSHESLGVAALVLGTLAGMPLAATLVTAVARPLPGTISVAGAEISTRTSWPPVLLFYGLLALVVLLAHLAHAYEFAFAALDPADDRDPLPILRKGLPKIRPKS